MRQQINLYQDVLIDKPEPFQSRQVSLLLVIAGLCLIMIGVYSFWQAEAMKRQVAELLPRQQEASARVLELEKQYPLLQQSAQLEEKIHRIEQELQGQKKALTYILEQNRDANGATLASLEGLARYPQQGVWLSRVRLFEGGREVQLSGSALRPEQVPEYLQLLGEKAIFGGQVFARLKLNRIKERVGQVDFKLDS